MSYDPRYPTSYSVPGEAPARRSMLGGRLVIALVVAVIPLVSYFAKVSHNPVTGESQHIAMTHEQEIALGMQSAPEMTAQMGGASADRAAQALVQRVGEALVRALPPEAPAYPYRFTLLADRQTVNAFALPGGPIFITEALLARITSEGQLAGVLGHEIGHVIARHSAERMAKAQLTQGLVGAATVAADPSSAQQTQAVASMVGQFTMMRYGRQDELESDALGVRFMARAGYDPRSMIGVMEILKHASGGGRQPDFMSTHPSPDNRIERLHQIIAEQFPQGVPGNLRE